MRKVIIGFCVVIPCMCGCDVGEYLSIMELLGNDTIVAAGIQIVQNIVTGILG